MDLVSPKTLPGTASHATVDSMQRRTNADAQNSGNDADQTQQGSNHLSGRFCTAEDQFAASYLLPSAPSNSNVRGLAIEVTIITLLNRARTLYGARMYEHAGQCLRQALEYVKYSSDHSLRQKCVDRMQRFYRNKHVLDKQTPLKTSISLQNETATPVVFVGPIPDSARSGNAEFDFQVELMKQGWAVQPLSAGGPSSTGDLRTQIAADSQRVEPARPRPRTLLSDDDGYNNINALLDSVRDAPSRRRRTVAVARAEFEEEPNSEVAGDILAAPSTPITADMAPRARSLGKLPPLKILGAPSGPLSSRRQLRRALLSPTTGPSHGSDDARPRASSTDSNITTISLMPLRRASMDPKHQLALHGDDSEPPLSIDGPSLSKLAETKNVNSSPRSSSSSATAVILRRLSQSSNRSTPLPALETLLPPSHTAHPPDSTVPLHHSPLRENFLAGSSAGEQRTSSAKVMSKFGTDPFASDKDVSTGDNSNHHSSSQQLKRRSFDDPLTTNSVLASSGSEAICNTPQQSDSNETMTDKDRLEAERKVKDVIDMLLKETVQVAWNEHQQSKAAEVQKSKNVEVQPKEQREEQRSDEFQSQLSTFFARSGITPYWDSSTQTKSTGNSSLFSKGNQVETSTHSRAEDDRTAHEMGDSPENTPRFGHPQPRSRAANGLLNTGSAKVQNFQKSPADHLETYEEEEDPVWDDMLNSVLTMTAKITATMRTMKKMRMMGVTAKTHPQYSGD